MSFAYLVLLLLFEYCFLFSSSCEASTNCLESREKYEERMTPCETIPPVNEPFNATDIVEELFDKRYDKRLRAGYGGEAVVIDVSLGFLSISEVVERNMEFTSYIYMRQLWKDTRLAFANKSTAIILQRDALEKLWLPDTFFENAVTTTVQKETRTAVLYGDGWIVFSQRIKVTARTAMNFQAYPMDKQVFALDLMSYGRDRNQVQYRWHNVELLNEEMSEFVILGSDTEQTTKVLFIGCFDLLTVKFYAKRRVGFYIIRIFFPCVLCTVVSWMAFWMDCSGVGDRGTVGITSLLSQLFLVGSINEAMPPVSYVKAADEFLIASFAFTFFALLETIVVYKTAQQESHKEEGPLFKNKENSMKEPVVATKFRALDLNNIDHDLQGIQGKDNEPSPDLPGKTGDKTMFAIFREISSKAKFIDRIARVVFPLGYVLFIVSYFLIYMS